MAKEKSPAYQRYPKDYLTDENVVLMTLEQEGAYNRLMDYCWIEGSIPDDPAKLAAKCKNVTLRKMQTMWPAIRPCFIPHPEEPGRLIHARLEKEREKQAEWLRKSSESGKAGAAKRWGGHGSPMAPPMPDYDSSSATAFASSFSSSNQATSSIVVDEDAVSRIVRSVNKGHIDNPRTPTAEPLLTNGRDRQQAVDWIEQGIPADLCERVCYQKAKDYKPNGLNKQIKSLTYCNAAVLQEWEAYKAINASAPKGTLHAVKRHPVPGSQQEAVRERNDEAPRAQERVNPIVEELVNVDALSKTQAQQENERVDVWSTANPTEASVLYAECRRDAERQNPGMWGEETITRMAKAEYRSRILKLLTPKAVA